ncbi:MAG: DUF2924 domain-containing protein [Amphiplicatus sp.]
MTAHQTSDSALRERIASIRTLSYAELHAEWRRLWRSAPPKKLSRDILELGVAWKHQEGALGGLTAKTKRELSALIKVIDQKGDVAPKSNARLRPGACLIRAWGGETHEVLALDDGFEWRGERWASLSAIARAITGAQWSGPRFFGLQRKATKTNEG